MNAQELSVPTFNSGANCGAFNCLYTFFNVINAVLLASPTLSSLNHIINELESIYSLREILPQALLDVERLRVSYIPSSIKTMTRRERRLLFQDDGYGTSLGNVAPKIIALPFNCMPNKLNH